MTALLVFLVWVAVWPAAALAQTPPEVGADLYIRRGCLGCHGASGRGGVGPTLANTKLTVDTFTQQVRKPRTFKKRLKACPARQRDQNGKLRLRRIDLGKRTQSRVDRKVEPAAGCGESARYRTRPSLRFGELSLVVIREAEQVIGSLPPRRRQRADHRICIGRNQRRLDQPLAMGRCRCDDGNDDAEGQRRGSVRG